MELKRLDIIGFKSFPEHICVSFSKGVTAIVGPNGSGKSNISDAVRWVLGEQSPRQLRGSKMEDVIFSGTARRKPLGYCEVTLVLGNEDKKIPVEYEEVAITRRLYRSGESEYEVNGGRCRLKDIQEMLMDTGIGKDGYSLIGQGQIDALLSSRPEDRRGIFEEASGITKYRSRKEEAEKKLSQETERLSRVSDILNELTSRLEPLREQSEKAEQYLKLKDELKLYEVSSFIGEYDLIESQYQKVSQALSDLALQMDEAEKRRASAQARSDELGKSVGQGRSALSALTKEIGQDSVTLEKLEGDRKVVQEQKVHAQNEIRSLQSRGDETKSRIVEACATLEKEKKHRSALEEKISAEKKKSEEMAGELSDLTQGACLLSEQRSRLVKESTALSSKLQEAQAELSRIEAVIDQESEQFRKHAEEELFWQQKIDTLTQETGTLDTSVKDQETSLAQAQKTYEEALAHVGDLREQEQKKSAERESGLLRLKDLQGRLNWLSGMDQNYEGYSASVKALMKLRQGSVRYTPSSGSSPDWRRQIHGTLADLIQVPAAYTIAMDTALGAGVQNVVVSTTEDARLLIEYLRGSKIGRATFLPLDSVKGRNQTGRESQILSMKGVVGMADQLVKADERYRAILSRQLGNVVIAQDFESGREVARVFGREYRVVTLQGDVFNIGGSITGGSNQAQKNGILSRRSEKASVEKELKEERDKAGVLFKELQQIGEEVKQASAVEKSAQEALHKAQARKTELEQQLHEKQFLLGEARSSFSRMEQEAEDHSSAKDARQEEKEAAEGEVERCKADESAAQEKISQIEAKITAQSEAISQCREKQGQQAIKTAGLEHEMAFASREIERQEGEIERLSTAHDELLSQQEASREEIARAESEIRQIEEKKQTLSNEISLKQQESEKLQANVTDTEQEREKALKETQECLKASAALEKEQVRLENQRSRAQKDMDDLSQRMWEDYQITYDAAKDLAQRGFNDDPDLLAASELSKTKRRQNISRLRGQIRELGDVNVNAITEYKSLKDRVSFLTTQRDDILTSQQDLNEIIAEMTKKMQEQFAKSFSQIARTFDTVFKQMFGGGQGLLQLTEGESSLEAGIEIIAQPPGKKLQNMTLLSGGEKALTAIALLFAIQQQNPAPFCILDEIEAALDDANVERYAHYLKQMSDQTQFIVITHRKGTMEVADTMYGVTMEEKGVSKCISVSFEEQEAFTAEAAKA